MSGCTKRNLFNENTLPGQMNTVLCNIGCSKLYIPYLFILAGLDKLFFHIFNLGQMFWTWSMCEQIFNLLTCIEDFEGIKNRILMDQDM